MEVVKVNGITMGQFQIAELYFLQHCSAFLYWIFYEQQNEVLIFY